MAWWIRKVIVVAPTSVMSGFGVILKILLLQTYKVVNTFNFDQPIFKLFDQGVLLEMITEGKLGGHTGLNSVMQLFGTRGRTVCFRGDYSLLGRRQ